MEIMKICTKCGQKLPLSEFYACKANKDGKSSYCKNCAKVYSKKRRKKVQDEKQLKIQFLDLGKVRYNARTHKNVLEVPVFKEPLPYIVTVSQKQSIWINVEAKSPAEAERKAYEILEQGCYADDLSFDENAELESVELDVIPEAEDYV